MLRFEPGRAAVAPKDAATLLVVRDGEQGLEIFCVRRHANSPFMGGAVVFPGGKLDAADRALASQTSGLHPRAASFADDADHGLALAVCACRESFEEAAILPLVTFLEDGEVEHLRSRQAAGDGFASLIGDRILATAALTPFARWITPEAEQRRYDARFFLTTLPAGQRGLHDARETTSSVWASPARMLEAFLAGDLFLAPPTLRALEILCEARDVAAAIALSDEQSLAPICPRFVPTDPPMLVLPGDPEHHEPDRRVAGPTRFVLRDGKFVSEEPDPPRRDPRTNR
jgi:8-oxo-dGTP pyrophosphatase MutT (NUDIX family)